ncbi:MAG: SPOR domain-containing protein [Bacteroidales bacterium]|nr:SPOR domain-containing protein [Bacteroidales bacterium]
MKKTLFFFTMLILNSFTHVFGQTEGSVRIFQDSRVDTLLAISRQYTGIQKIDGFRIQIFMESGNEAVNSAHAAIKQFSESFPDLPSYLSFGQPYYRVRVGDFRTRLEAEGQLRFIVQQFGQAFIIKDLIEPPQLSSFPSKTFDQ